MCDRVCEIVNTTFSRFIHEVLMMMEAGWSWGEPEVTAKSETEPKEKERKTRTRIGEVKEEGRSRSKGGLGK